MQTLSRTVDELTSIITSFAHSLVSARQTRQLNFAFFPAKKGLPKVPLDADTASRSDSVLLPPSADDELDETSRTALLVVTFASEDVCASALGSESDMLGLVVLIRRPFRIRRDSRGVRRWQSAQHRSAPFSPQ